MYRPLLPPDFRSTQLFAELADEMPHFVWLQRPDGQIVWANRRWHEYTQLDGPLAFTAEAWKLVIHPDDFQPTVDEFIAAGREGRIFEAEHRSKPLHGGADSYRWFLARAVPIRDAAGQISAFIGTGTDIHQAKLAQENFRSGLHTMIELLPVMAWTSDPAGVTTYENSRFTEYTGVSAGRMSPAEFMGRIHPDDVAAVAATWHDCLTRRVSFSVQFRLRDRYGAYHWVLSQATPVAAQGGISGWVGTIMDIDEHKQAEQRLLHSLEREHQISEAFQRAALPPSLPSVPGLVLSAAYRPGGNDAIVGGDWYDAVLLDERHVLLSIGDVAGSGLAAAVTMAAARQSLRSIARLERDPLAILAAADANLRSEGHNAIVTALIAVYSIADGMLAYARAGHPPGIVRRASGEPALLAGGVGVPLGLRDLDRGEIGLARLHPGDTLVLYTDGLTEATRDVLKGEEQLLAAIAANSADDSNLAVLLKRAVTGTSTPDDVAVLTLHRL